MTNEETIKAMPLEQLESIIRWNENGNDTLSDEPYTKEDLIETVISYCEETPLNELLALMGYQFEHDKERLIARGIIK